jgi:exosortase
MGIGAHLPMWGLHLWRLGQHPAYGCVPLGLLVILIWIYRCRETWSFWGGRLSWTVLLTSAWVQCVSVVLWSPWLSAVSGLLSVGAIVFGRSGRHGTPVLCQLWTLMWLGLPLPLGWDADLASGLQDLASRAASRLLDLLHVDHCRLGYLIEVPGYRYVVETGCSGMNSAYAIVLLTGLYSCWRQLRGARFCGLLLAALCWALLINAVRIAMLVAVHKWWQWDIWVRGWHGLAALCVVVMVMGLVVSTNALLTFATTTRSENACDGANASDTGQRDVNVSAWTTPSDTGRRSRALTLPIVLIVVPYAISIGLQLAGWIGYGFVAEHIVAPGPQRRLLEFTANDLKCPQGSGWTRIGFQGTNGSSQGVALHSRFTWTYRFVDGTAVFVIDYPSSSWHDLVHCYRSQGWQCSERKSVSQGEVHLRGTTEVALCRSASPPALLLFLQASVERTRQASPGIRQNRLMRLAERLQLRCGRAGSNPGIQLQLFVQLRHHIDEQQRWRLRRHFGECVAQVFERLDVSGGRPLTAAEHKESRSVVVR